VFIVVLLGAAVGRCVAELTPGQKLAVEALIKQFGAKEFTVRQKAVERLIEIGPDVVPLVKKAADETTDNEVRLRCQMVLTGIAEKYGIAIETQAMKKKTVDHWRLGPSRININVANATVEEILEILAKQSGNAPVLADGKVALEQIGFHLTDVPYWQAIERLCHRVHCLYRPAVADDPSPPELVFVDVCKEHGLVVGPVLVKVAEASKRKQLRRYRQFMTSSSFGRRDEDPVGAVIKYTLICLWEDRLPVVNSTVTIDRVTAPDGTALAVRQGDPYGPVDKRARASDRIRFHIDPVPEGVERVGTIEGTVKLTLALGPPRQITIDKLLEPGEHTVKHGPLTLTADVRHFPDSRTCIVTLRALRDGRPSKELISLKQAQGGYGAFLVDQKGKTHRAQRVRGGRTVLVATFTRLAQVEGNWSLRCRWAEKTETHTYPFRMSDVPQP